jgi:hypothetical protein
MVVVLSVESSYQERVEVEHDEEAARGGGLDHLVHDLHRGQALQVGVGAVVDAARLRVIEHQVQIERNLRAVCACAVCAVRVNARVRCGVCACDCRGRRDGSSTRMALKLLMARKSRRFR